MAIRRKCELARSPSQVKKSSNSPFRHQIQRHEPYQFPLNLALLHQSQDEPNMKALQALAATAPEVLRMEDGQNGGGSLTIALRHHPRNLKLVQLLLKTNPRCIETSDRRGNTPLHVACFQGAPLEVIVELYGQDPTAIDRTNIAGDTPWNIIQQNGSPSSKPVAEFLYACSKRREGRMRISA
jgi:ankyrin repeat protein